MGQWLQIFKTDMNILRFGVVTQLLKTEKSFGRNGGSRIANGYVKDALVHRNLVTAVNNALKVCKVFFSGRIRFPQAVGVLEGTMDFQQTASLAANTKILLNSMLSFKNGIHDRVLTAMQNGAVCVTDSSSYIDAHFQNNHDIVLYDVKNMNMLPGIIRELLENPEKAREIAQNGRQKALSSFTWDNFVKKYILERLD